MMSDREVPMAGEWGVPYEADPRCQWCERSIVTRFGGVGPTDCPSCEADFRRELTRSGGLVEMA